MIKKLVPLLAAAERMMVFTGAGVSVDSGIPDFRTPGGIWDRIDPMTLSRSGAEGSPARRAEFWRAMRSLADSLGDPKPNAVHHAVVALDQRGQVGGVVTQNIDGLHQAAGSTEVIELHANHLMCHCLGCGDRLPTAEVVARVRGGEAAPSCRKCGGIIRPELVLFEDMLPVDALRRAERLALSCDLCLVLGSSLVVHPAADLPRMARRAGAKLVIATLGPTPIDDWAHLKIDAPLADVFVPAVRKLPRRRSES
ncbi:MAG: hypothetical protein KC620_00980 [Myxococcales bacterium]|nr:hypothetical protein [Myxococcales bacterium]